MKSKTRAGFTLIELLVYSAIFAIVIVGFLSILVTVTQIESRQAAESVVNQESQFLLSTIQRYVENSSMVDIPENVATSTLTLRTAASSTDPSSIYLSETTVYLRQTSSGIAQALTSPNVKVTSLSFTRKLNPPGHDSVATNFTIAYYVSTMPQNVSRSLQLSVSRVSAATFDSSIIPSSTWTYSLGVSGQLWNSVNGIIKFDNGDTNVGINTQSSPGQALEVNGGVRLRATSVSKPTCDAVTGRDTLWVTETSTVGTADSFQICSRQDNGTYAWASPASNPAGSNGQIQFNSSTAFGADPNLFWDNTNKRLGIGTSTPNNSIQVANLINFDNSQKATYLGYQAGTGVSTLSNTAVGYKALASMTGGTGRNTALGAWALYSNGLGTDNIAIGDMALASNTAGNSNIAIGSAEAGNLGIMHANIGGSYNIGIGASSTLMNNVGGGENIAIGDGALQNLNGDLSNVQNGQVSGSGNIAIGRFAGVGEVTGGGNVFIGTFAGNLETESNKLYIANQEGTPLIYGDFHTVRVGIGMKTPAVALQVQGDIRVGTSGTNGCLQNFAGTSLAGTCVSDTALKIVTGPVIGILDKLSGLQLVTYQWNDTAARVYHNGTSTTNTGFIAQDVEKLFPNLVVTDKNGYKTLDYTTLNLYSLEGVKELNQKVELQQKEIDSLKRMVCEGHLASALCAGAIAP